MRIAILPGDGIGPEVTRATRTVLDALNSHLGLGLDMTEYAIGLASLEAGGTILPDAVCDAARAADGVILGPVDTFAYPPTAKTSASGGLRKQLDLYANIRPSRARPGVPAPAPDMDLVIVRENTEGFYADRNMAQGSGEFRPDDDTAFAMRKITRAASTRIAETAFALARERRKSVTAVHKANVLKVTDGLFLDSVRAVGAKYPDIRLDEMLVDAMAAALITEPTRFDVVLCSNMFGDILSDEAAALTGGLGLASSLNMGTDHGVAQAVHGAAPDIAGNGIANPSALMLSVGMLLEWLGTRHQRRDLTAAARHLGTAVEQVLATAAHHTPDMGGNTTTDDFAAAVVQAVQAADESRITET